MTNAIKLQLFLLMLIAGFLTGPRVMALIDRGSGTALGGEGANNTAAAIGSEAETPARSASSSDPYERLVLEAKSVYVWDINDHKRLYAKNEHKVMPLASVTKMMMALVAAETLSSDSEITILPTDLLEEGDSGLRVGEKWSFADLIKFTLVTSSNDGASAIASVAGAKILGDDSSDPISDKRLFIERMNQKAAAIGLTQTSFHSESGLDLDSVTSGAYGTSRDMGVLFEYILHKHPELFTATTYPKIDITSGSKIVHHVANTNTGVAAVTGIIGSKTGYTDLAGGNLVVVVDIGIDHPVVIAVLGSTREGRFSDVEKLIDATVTAIANVPVPLSRTN